MKSKAFREYISEEIKGVLFNYPFIKLGIVFGSVAVLRNRPNSDVDLGVAATAVLTVEQKIALIEDITVKLERELDLVDLMSINGPILQQILCRGHIFLKKDTSLYARLILKMWYNQADLIAVLLPNIGNAQKSIYKWIKRF